MVVVRDIEVTMLVSVQVFSGHCQQERSDHSGDDGSGSHPQSGGVQPARSKGEFFLKRTQSKKLVRQIFQKYCALRDTGV